MQGKVLVRMAGLVALLLAGSCLAAATSVSLEWGATPLAIPEAARAGPDFDVDRATQAWIETLSADARARSDAYVEGSYWLYLGRFLYVVGFAALLLFSGLSARLADMTEWTRWNAVNAGLYGFGFVILAGAALLPLSLYGDFYREHQYGLANLDRNAWLLRWLTGVGIMLVVGPLALGVLYAVLRRTGEYWWMWSTGASVILATGVLLLSPVLVTPLFDDYRALPEGEVRDRMERLARANGIDPQDIYWFDASRRHNRISAHVEGLGASRRIALNDNLLAEAPLESIEAVMGHEIGHYVLGHGRDALLRFAIVAFVGFAFIAVAFRNLRHRYNAWWNIRGIDDPAGFPLIVALVAIFGLLATPVINSMSQSAETGADLYGINASRQPDGFAFIAMQLSAYRKVEPHWLEERLLHTHPSAQTRVRMAMQWKAEQQTARLDQPPRALDENLPEAGEGTAEDRDQ